MNEKSCAKRRLRSSTESSQEGRWEKSAREEGALRGGHHGGASSIGGSVGLGAKLAEGSAVTTHTSQSDITPGCGAAIFTVEPNAGHGTSIVAPCQMKTLSAQSWSSTTTEKPLSESPQQSPRFVTRIAAMADGRANVTDHHGEGSVLVVIMQLDGSMLKGSPSIARPATASPSTVDICVCNPAKSAKFQGRRSAPGGAASTLNSQMLSVSRRGTVRVTFSPLAKHMTSFDWPCDMGTSWAQGTPSISTVNPLIWSPQQSPRLVTRIKAILNFDGNVMLQNGFISSFVNVHPPASQSTFGFPSTARAATPPSAVDDCSGVRALRSSHAGD